MDNVSSLWIIIKRFAVHMKYFVQNNQNLVNLNASKKNVRLVAKVKYFSVSKIRIYFYVTQFYFVLFYLVLQKTVKCV